jgi:hypothetical protein
MTVIYKVSHGSDESGIGASTEVIQSTSTHTRYVVTFLYGCNLQSRSSCVSPRFQPLQERLNVLIVPDCLEITQLARSLQARRSPRVDNNEDGMSIVGNPTLPGQTSEMLLDGDSNILPPLRRVTRTKYLWPHRASGIQELDV